MAGRTGFCPECGVRLVIPLQSTRQSSRESAVGQEPAQDDPMQDLALDGGQDDPFGVPAMPANMMPNTVLPNAQADNPLLQDQTVVWYLQVPGGQRFGPANGQTIQSWIRERRIMPQMLIWREGWEQWLEAKEVFPEIT